jgi:hypothetical protein
MSDLLTLRSCCCCQGCTLPSRWLLCRLLSAAQGCCDELCPERDGLLTSCCCCCLLLSLLFHCSLLSAAGELCPILKAGRAAAQSYEVPNKRGSGVTGGCQQYQLTAVAVLFPRQPSTLKHR